MSELPRIGDFHSQPEGRAEPGRQGAILSSIATLVDRGLLRPHVSAVFPLEQLADAHRQIETGHTVGKVAVTVA